MGNGIRWTPQMVADHHRKLGTLHEPQPEKPSKYRNKKVVIDGEAYDSKREAARHAFLKEYQANGHISSLIRQVTFVLAPKVKQAGQEKVTPAIRYVADFIYVQDGRLVVEDCKGAQTRVYKMKRHLMKTRYDITILET